MNLPLTIKPLRPTTLLAPAVEPRGELPAIFGLRYLEEEAAEIHDVVGCIYRADPTSTGTGCDDTD